MATVEQAGLAPARRSGSCRSSKALTQVASERATQFHPRDLRIANLGDEPDRQVGFAIFCFLAGNISPESMPASGSFFSVMTGHVFDNSALSAV